jgi:chaperonin cofactor prefoldin
MDLTFTPPCVSLLHDKIRQFEACIATLEKQNKELKTRLAELEGAQKTEMKATTAGPKKENKAEVQ